jgi:hypothetical protein
VELFFGQRFFFSGQVGQSYFSASKFFFCRRVFSAGEFFLQASFFPLTVFGFYYFSVVRKMVENPVGFLPHPFLYLSLHYEGLFKTRKVD